MAARVLVVEDEEPIRQTVARNLRRRGYEVDEARTVAWAVERCARDAPDLLLLDINLPDGSGWDVLRALRAHGLPRPAVIAISAAPPMPVRLTEFGPVSYLPKPFVIDALLRAVGRACAKEHDHEALDHHAI